jgi:hypothetical protein
MVLEKRSVFVLADKSCPLTLWASRAISAQVGVSSYLEYESCSPTATGCVSSVKAASHNLRDTAARMIVGPGMMVAVAAVDIGVCSDMTLVHSALRDNLTAGSWQRLCLDFI